MARLGPFEAAPALAVAASGGADSTALALLARDWVARRGGSLVALVVDHGLRPESRAEATLTLRRLAAQGIGGRMLVLRGLAHGPGLAARARAARYRALADACAAAGVLHLLLGHHAGDQAETVMMRAGAGSTDRGLAGMGELVERPQVRLLRPLLAEAPGLLRHFLRDKSMEWVEDPSNRDPATLRARLRTALADPEGGSEKAGSLLEAARHHGAARVQAEMAVARELAARVQMHPAGWALLTPGPLSSMALSALLCTVAGRTYPVRSAQVEGLAAAPRAATVAGVRLLPAGRLGRGWLVVREEAAMAARVAAVPGAVWDARFRLSDPAATGRGWTIGALADDAAGMRRPFPRWPAAVLRTLPALRDGSRLIAVPTLDWPDRTFCARFPLVFAPALALAGAPFRPI